MAEILDYRGLRCPQPVLKAALAVQKMAAGMTVEILADCPEFPHDVKTWCDKSHRVLISIVEKGDHHVATIRT